MAGCVVLMGMMGRLVLPVLLGLLVMLGLPVLLVPMVLLALMGIRRTRLRLRMALLVMRRRGWRLWFRPSLVLPVLREM